MNNARRKSLKSLIKQLNDLAEGFEALKNDSEEICYAIEEIRDEEQDSFDNLPEGIQESSRGERMEEVIDTLDEAISNLEYLDIDDIISYINETIENLENAIS